MLLKYALSVFLLFQYTLSVDVDLAMFNVTVLDSAPNGSRGKEMADALQKIASRGGISSITDPVAWQREIRKDRPLADAKPG